MLVVHFIPFNGRIATNLVMRCVYKQALNVFLNI